MIECFIVWCIPSCLQLEFRHRLNQPQWKPICFCNFATIAISMTFRWLTQHKLINRNENQYVFAILLPLPYRWLSVWLTQQKLLCFIHWKIPEPHSRCNLSFILHLSSYHSLFDFIFSYCFLYLIGCVCFPFRSDFHFFFSKVVFFDSQLNFLSRWILHTLLGFGIQYKCYWDTFKN